MQGEAGFGSCILEVGKLDLVIATSRGKLGGRRTLAHSFVATPDRMPTFMHLGVFAAQARAVSIVARASCVIWLLERSATRAVLGKRAWDALPYLRRVNLLACMSLGQLDRVVVSMRPKVFGPNETIVKRGGDSVFGIVAQGEVCCGSCLVYCVQLPDALILHDDAHQLLHTVCPDEYMNHRPVNTHEGCACQGHMVWLQ